MRVGELPNGLVRAEKVEFNFTINRSFLRRPSHTITVLQEYNPTLARHILSNHHEIALCTSNGKALNAYIYSGVSTWGLYFQIIIPQREYKIIGGDYYLDQEIAIELKLSHIGNIAAFLKTAQKFE